MHKIWDRYSVVQERLAGAVQELKLCERDVTSIELELGYQYLDEILKSYI